MIFAGTPRLCSSHSRAYASTVSASGPSNMLAMRRACAARACQSDVSDDWASAMARLINGCDDKRWREKIRSTILVILAISSPSSDSGSTLAGGCGYPPRSRDAGGG